MPTDQIDAVNTPSEAKAERSPEPTPQELSSSVWDELKQISGKISSAVDRALGNIPGVLEMDPTSLYGSIHDNTAGKGTAPNDSAGKDAGDTKEPSLNNAAPGTINRDVEPAEYLVKRGDSLNRIAKEHLGPDATQEEIRRHVQEIARLNNIKNPDLIHPNDKLQLPGHTADGGTITKDEAGNRVTEWQDGRLKVERPDGTGYEVKPDGDGGYKETHWGPEAKDHLEKTVDKDGVVIEKDHEGNKTTTWPNGNELVENKDETGYLKVVGTDGRYTEQHWGHRAEDHYLLTPQVDGSYQGTDLAGNTRTRWDDGTERVDYKDGRGYVRKPDAAGGHSEHHWGPRPEDNFELKKTADGKTEIAEKAGDAPHKEIDDPEVKAEREKLKELAEEKIDDPKERAKFEADMARLEERSKQLEQTFIREGLSTEEARAKANKEIAETYKQVGRLLEAKDNPDIKLTEHQRVQLAEQVMSQAATPTSVNQGMHPTCNVATVEARTYTRSPSEAAKLVADVATTGEYVTKDGTKIKIDAGSITPHDQAKTHPPVDGQRGHASQIFQVTAVNIHYTREGEGVRYEQREPDPTDPSDNGERRVDYSEDPPEEHKEHAPGLSDEKIVEVGNQITGQDKHDWYIRHGEDKWIGDDKVVNIDSEEKLEEKIREAKEQGKLPIVVKVHSGNEPFYTDSGAGRAGGSGGWHVVTITDYDPATGKVSIDNQWGSYVDHNDKKSQVSVHDLYLSMRAPDDDDQIEILEDDVEHDKVNGQRDYYKEAELLRLQQADGDLSDTEYKEKLEQTMKDAAKHWDELRKDGTLDHKEYVKEWVKIRDLMHNFPPDQRMDMIAKAKESGFYESEDLYQRNVASEVLALKAQEKADKEKGMSDDKQKEYDRANEKIKTILQGLPEAKRQEIEKKIEELNKK